MMVVFCILLVLPSLLRSAYSSISFYITTPLRIQKMMKKQGISGPKPNFFLGNISEISSLISMSNSQDIISATQHDIVYRLLPHYLLWSRQYGIYLYIWFIYNWFDLYLYSTYHLFIFIICIYIGERFIYWNGFEPRLCLTETELIKELLTKYNSVSGKSWMQQQGSKNFIGRGLLMANGEDWYHQRHAAAAAFTFEKLKVS